MIPMIFFFRFEARLISLYQNLRIKEKKRIKKEFAHTKSTDFAQNEKHGQLFCIFYVIL